MTSVVGLFGDPVEGNPTSRMQNAAFQAAGLDWIYLDFHVRPQDLAQAVAAARLLRFGGLNLTIPHKVAVLPLLDELEPSAQITGAVNTVCRDSSGRFIGLNTDGFGFLAAIREAGTDPAGTSVVLLGAGGAARAVAVELALAGAARITVANRSVAHREELAELIRTRTAAASDTIAWTDRLVPPPCDLLVNCTPIGMGFGAAAEERPAVDLDGLEASTVVCDVNPDRAESAFLRTARECGFRTLGGLPMLARQGAAGFTAWTGVPAPLEIMIAELERLAAASRGLHA